MHINKNKILKTIITRNVLVVSVLFFAISSFVFAASSQSSGEKSGSSVTSIIGGILTSAVSGLILSIISLLQGIAGFLLYLGAKLISFMFQFNVAVIDFPIINVGWQIIRDIANLGFVIAFIVIAFMTILRVSSYNAQKMLPKLIAAIILVNFSLTIAGFILDFTHVVTKFFVDHALQGGSFAATQDVGSAIANTLQPQKYFKTKSMSESAMNNFIEEGPDFTRDILENIISAFAIMIFTYFMAFLLLANALMLTTRFVYIAVLLVLSPIPWLFGVIPISQITQRLRDWWSKFLEWAFVAPILSFFLYITLATAQNMRSILEGKISGAATDETFTNISDFWLLVGNTLILGGFLAAGLIASKSLGGKLAAGAIDVGIKTANNAKKFATSIATGTAGRVGRRFMTAGAASDKEGKTWGEKLGETKAAKIPVIGAALRGIAGASTKVKEKLQEDIEKSQKKYASLSKETLKNRINSQVISKTIGAMNEDDVGAALALAEKGGWHELSENVRNKLIAAIKRSGAAKKLASFDPLAAASTGVIELEDAVGRVENPVNLKDYILKEIAPYLRPEQRRQIGNKGSIKQKEAVVEGLKEAFISSAIPKKDEQGKETPEFIKEKEMVEKAFQKLEEQKAKLNEILKKYADAKDKRAPKEEIEKIQKERDLVRENVSNLNKILVEGGNWVERIPTGAFDENGNPVIKTGETIIIQPPQVKEGETENKELQKRKMAMNARNDLAKQTAWQGEKLFKPNKQTPSEEEF